MEDKNDSKIKKISEEPNSGDLKWLLEKYRLLAENSVDCIWTLDKDLRFTYLSPSLERILGFKPKEWMGTSLASHFRAEEYTKIEMLTIQAIKNYQTFTHITFETKMLNKENKEVDLEITGKVLLDKDGSLIGLQGATRSIGERKKSEEKIFENEERFKALFDTIGSGVAIYEVYQNGENFIFKDLNKAAENLSLIKREEVVGKKVTEIFPGVQEIGLFDIFKKVYRTGKTIHLPIAMYQDNRIQQWVENTVYKLPSGEIVAVYEDTTVQRKAEKAMRESEAKYRAIFENMASASCLDEIVYDKGKPVDYRILDVNSAYEKLYGINRERAIDSFASQLYGTGEPPYLDIYSKVAKTGKPASFETYFEPIKKYLYITVSTPKAGVVSILAADITELKKSEHELKKLKNSLQTQMEEKTKELQERIVELERLHEATIDREFRIKELKDEIKRLKRET